MFLARTTFHILSFSSPVLSYFIWANPFDVGSLEPSDITFQVNELVELQWGLCPFRILFSSCLNDNYWVQLRRMRMEDWDSLLFSITHLCLPLVKSTQPRSSSYANRKTATNISAYSISLGQSLIPGCAYVCPDTAPGITIYSMYLTRNNSHLPMTHSKFFIHNILLRS